MSQRFRPRPSFANVISIIALFAALGGGYAVAFSGSGTLQKADKVGISQGGGFETIRTLTGIGSIQAECSAGPQLTIRFNNNTDLSLVSYMDAGGVDPVATGVGPDGGGFDTVATAVSASDALRYHIHKRDGGKRPQADVTVSTSEAGACSNSRVAVLALNTEE